MEELKIITTLLANTENIALVIMYIMYRQAIKRERILLEIIKEVLSRNEEH